jgi:hypothetical protein
VKPELHQRDKKKEKLITRGIGRDHQTSAENLGWKKSDEHAGTQA